MTYQERIARAFELRPDLFRGGSIQHLSVHHDDWCAGLVQGNACDCNPDLVFASNDGRQHYQILRNGAVVRTGERK